MNVKPIFETVTLFSDKFAACRDFYHSALELPLVFEDEVSAVFEFGGIMVNVLALSEADELVIPQAARGNPVTGWGVCVLKERLADSEGPAMSGRHRSRPPSRPSCKPWPPTLSSGQRSC